MHGGVEQQVDRSALYASHRAIAKLAPFVERLAARLDRGSRSSTTAPILPRAPGSATLRPDTRKVLVFDRSARAPIWIALGVLFYVVPLLLALLHEVVTGGSTLVSFIVALVLTGAGLLGCALAVVLRLCALRRLFARCVVVPGLVTDARVCRGRLLRYSMILTIEYPYGGRRYQRTMGYGSPEADVMGWTIMGSTPALLVDTENPHQLFIRELYV